MINGSLNISWMEPNKPPDLIEINPNAVFERAEFHSYGLELFSNYYQEIYPWHTVKHIGIQERDPFSVERVKNNEV